LQAINGFFQIPIEEFEHAFEEENQHEDEQYLQLTIIPYGIANSPAKYISAVGQFDKLHTQFFDNGDYSIIMPTIQSEL